MLTAELLPRSGKVRDLYSLPDRRLVLVASDRISAFDVILPTPIPEKGKVLTGLSRFWFDATRSIIRNHLLDTEVDVVVDGYSALLERHGQEPRDVIPDDGFEAWRGRVMVCWPASVIPIEAVVRGYLSGSAWKEYRERGSVCGIALPGGLRESEQLPAPIFTPATKAPAGEHDRNLSFDEAIEHVSVHGYASFLGRTVTELERAGVGSPMQMPLDQARTLVEAVRVASLKLYRFGAAVAAQAGLVLADTKFEFGLPMQVDLVAGGPAEEQLHRRPIGNVLEDAPTTGAADRMMLIDELLTPDSSRFWDADAYAPGGPQASYDKQFVRDWLEGQAWDKRAPGPELPDDVVDGTRARYVEAFERITGGSFERYLREDVIGPEVEPE